MRGTYKRPLGELDWQKTVVSLQRLMGHALTVGARTALDLQGFSHYLSPTGPSTIHLYGR
ncbi:AbiEi antitoxin N-terminal domain-containing protein, partial [Rhizobium ruizarguesonis]